MKALLVALALSVPAVAMAEQRFAIVVGNDVGSAGRPKLWFAQHDAASLSDLLVELGSFPREQVMLLEGRSVRELRAAFQTTNHRIAVAKAKGETTVLVVYYSGHAATRGFELGTERLSYADFRKLIGGSPASAKVAIVDACESGEVTQVKGGRAVESINFSIRPNDRVEGVAYLASTAVGEPAQESAALGGSFFTIHLEAGLRGAADSDQDGRVTLAEAFRYASEKTIATTTLTAIGPQHPTWNLNLSGRGDMVLTDRRHADATLELPPDRAATYVVLNQGAMVSEVQGDEKSTYLALPAGSYTIERHSRAGITQVEMTLEKGQTVPLSASALRAPDQGTSKGGGIDPTTPARLLDGELGRIHPLGSIALTFGG